MPIDYSEVYNVCIDRRLIAAVDAWASRSSFEPSRRQAVQALLRIGLKHVNRHAQVAKVAPAPLMSGIAIGIQLIRRVFRASGAMPARRRGPVMVRIMMKV
jgi:hypothetical protein